MQTSCVEKFIFIRICRCRGHELSIENQRNERSHIKSRQICTYKMKKMKANSDTMMAYQVDWKRKATDTQTHRSFKIRSHVPQYENEQELV